MDLVKEHMDPLKSSRTVKVFNIMIKKIFFLTALFFFNNFIIAQNQKNTIDFSKAGFYEITDCGRKVFDFNIGWRFFKGTVKGAKKNNFDDSDWNIVSTPHGLELMSDQASGSNNYQGEAWYRKHFTVPDSIAGKRIIIYFEAVMGKSKVWLNGALLATHYGGYLPFSVDISDKIIKGKENILTVWTDNSDDPTYPPGKPQKNLDFAYFGGIYRDVWLVSTNPVYITDPNQVDKISGGGTFVHFEDLSEEKVNIVVQTDIENSTSSSRQITIKYILKNADGTVVSKNKTKATLLANSSKQVNYTLKVHNPALWSPKDPVLYDLEIFITGKSDEILDGVSQKIGIRKVEFRGKDGLYLNNKPYPGKLIGVNRHQDFAYIGNALPNSGQWRDALLLKQGGCDIIRAAHYPADPAFMDACDALGMFFIVATPGWQFWNGKDQAFEKRVYKDIRNMVRRDRNHPSVLMWEPILNETNYPNHFAQKVHNIIHEEYPFQGAYTACDIGAKGQQYFDVVYSHPYKGTFYNNLIDNTPENHKKLLFEYDKEKRSVFTREWGDCVDDWNSHNSPSRVARSWGEYPQLVQAQHYARPTFIYTSLESLYRTPEQHVGGALWHAFDHQRGYHPDPFYGGLTDVFRQAKYSYYLFKSQRSPAESKPMVFISHEMTPFSPSDVHVFSNCDEVRLILYKKDTLTIKKDRQLDKMPSPIFVFKDVYDFADVKNLFRNRKKEQAVMIAEGLIHGKVVVRYKKMPATRVTQIKLDLINDDIPLVANGSDMVMVIASMVDKEGNIKRLNNEYVKFEISGEGAIIGDSKIMANPKKVEWGTAPVLIRSTTIPGKITIKASIPEEGINKPASGELTFFSVPSPTPLLFLETPVNSDLLKADLKNNPIDSASEQKLRRDIYELNKELNDLKLKEVEKQQEEFEGTGRN